MKTLFISILIIVIISCNSTKRVYKKHETIVEKSYNVPDSTLELGYNPSQRAFALYLRSLPQEEKNKWISSGSYSEIELNEFLGGIDSLQMDIQLPDPPNSIIPDSSKNK
jgi:hypothetical protein